MLQLNETKSAQIHQGVGHLGYCDLSCHSPSTLLKTSLAIPSSSTTLSLTNLYPPRAGSHLVNTYQYTTPKRATDRAAAT